MKSVANGCSDKESVYLTTAVVARCLLSMPAIPVQWEKLFSATGGLIMKPRLWLLPVQIEYWSSLRKGVLRLGNAISWELSSPE